MTELIFREHYWPVYRLNGINFDATYRNQKITIFITRDALDLLPGADEVGPQIAFERNRSLIHLIATRVISTSSSLFNKPVICISPIVMTLGTLK